MVEKARLDLQLLGWCLIFLPSAGVLSDILLLYQQDYRFTPIRNIADIKSRS